MGLGFKHCEARWSYSGFHEFRTRLADHIGIAIDDMIGFGGDREWPSPLKDPIIDLLNHSDCDGELSPEQCAAIAPRLRRIVESWNGEYPIDYDKRNALLLADGMEEAAKNGESLEFC